MSALTAHSYGKTGVRLAKVERAAAEHLFHDLTIKLWLEGDFAVSYTHGDNTTSLPTDTMLRTCHALAADGTLAEAEVFLTGVLQRLLEVTGAAASAHAEVVVHAWDRQGATGWRRGNGDGTASLTATRDAVTIGSGITGLDVVRTAGSAYKEFLTDDFTFLPETDDRIMATSVVADWAWTSAPVSYSAARATARDVITQTFLTHDSLAVQQTLFACGEAVLAALPEVDHVSLRMPNRHHVPVDLTPYGRTNRNEVFVVQDRPYGEILGTVSRSTRAVS